MTVRGGYKVDRPAVLVVPPWAIKVAIATTPFIVSNAIKMWRRWRSKVGKVVTITHQTDIGFSGNRVRAEGKVLPFERKVEHARTVGIEIDLSKKTITIASFFAET